MQKSSIGLFLCVIVGKICSLMTVNPIGGIRIPYPVSYTHLDVYKRQGLGAEHQLYNAHHAQDTGLLDDSDELVAHGGQDVAHRLGPVSYTHLKAPAHKYGSCSPQHAGSIS